MTREQLYDYNEGYIAFINGEDRDENESQHHNLGWDDAEAEEAKRNA